MQEYQCTGGTFYNVRCFNLHDMLLHKDIKSWLPVSTCYFSIALIIAESSYATDGIYRKNGEKPQ